MDRNLSKKQDITQVTPPPVSLGTKEREKIVTLKKKEVGRAREIEPGEKGGAEEITFAETTPKIPPELKAIGVEPIVPPEIPRELDAKVQVISLPITKQEAEAGAVRPLVDSFRWMLTLFMRLVRKVGGRFRYVFLSP